MLELANNIKATSALAYANQTADTDGVIIDVQGFEEITFLVHLHAVSTADDDNYFTATVEEGDESDLSDAADVADGTGTEPSRYVGASPSDRKVDATTQAGDIMRIGVKVGTKRYMRLYVDENATGTADITASGIAVLSGARHRPVSQ